MSSQTLRGVSHSIAGGVAASSTRLPPSGAEYGGDFADVLPLRKGRAFVVGDVAGHGPEAGGRAFSLRTCVRRLLHGEYSPEGVLCAANAEMKPHEFATLFLAISEPVTGLLMYASAGHPTVLIFSSAGHVHLDATGPLLGLSGSESLPFAQRGLLLPRDAVLVAVTDGIIDARIPDEKRDRFFGTSGVVDAYQRAIRSGCDPAELIFQQARRRAGGSLSDDATVLVAPLFD
jgi:serine phosphatase RsbU (regulator of sigma subunit)